MALNSKRFGMRGQISTSLVLCTGSVNMQRVELHIICRTCSTKQESIAPAARWLSRTFSVRHEYSQILVKDFPASAEAVIYLTDAQLGSRCAMM